MNVLMFGFDSMSRMTYIRNLPQTYTYLTQELGAVVLEGYNIVGKTPFQHDFIYSSISFFTFLFFHDYGCLIERPMRP